MVNRDGGLLNGEVMHPALLADLGLHRVGPGLPVDQVNPTELVRPLGLHVPDHVNALGN